MKPPDEAMTRAELWWEFVVRDLGAARILLGQADMEAIVCFHAQQAAEKALKAYLAFLSEDDIPKTHDLSLLQTLVVQRGGDISPAEGIEHLDQHAVASRYPEEEAPTALEATEALGSATRLIAVVREAIGFRELSPHADPGCEPDA